MPQRARAASPCSRHSAAVAPSELDPSASAAPWCTSQSLWPRCRERSQARHDVEAGSRPGQLLQHAGGVIGSPAEVQALQARQVRQLRQARPRTEGSAAEQWAGAGCRAARDRPCSPLPAVSGRSSPSLSMYVTRLLGWLQQAKAAGWLATKAGLQQSRAVSSERGAKSTRSRRSRSSPPQSSAGRSDAAGHLLPRAPRCQALHGWQDHQQWEEGWAAHAPP